MRLFNLCGGELVDSAKYHKDNLSPWDWRDRALHNLDITIKDLEDYEA